MPRPPVSNAAFAREVQDEVRRDQLGRFGRRYGVIVGAVLLLALLAAAGWIAWRSHDEGRAGVEGERLNTALQDLSDGKTATAVPALETLARSDRRGYATAAQLTLAANAIDKKNERDALIRYTRISTNPDLPQPFRDLALIRATALELERMPPAQVVARMQPFLVPGNPWHGSAGEMTAAALVKLGRQKQAGVVYAGIAADATVPSTIRTRAARVAGVYGADAVALPRRLGGN